MSRRRREPELRVRVPFDALERFVARTHPDPDGDRQHQAKVRGCVVSAPWVAAMIGIDSRKVNELRKRGVSFFDADEYATRLGVHPSTIWADWWNLEEPQEPVWKQLRREALAESQRLREVAA